MPTEFRLGDTVRHTGDKELGKVVSVNAPAPCSVEIEWENTVGRTYYRPDGTKYKGDHHFIELVERAAGLTEEVAFAGDSGWRA